MARKDTPPNVLGRTLRYFTDAVAYARAPAAKGSSSGVSTRVNPLIAGVLHSNAMMGGGDDSAAVEHFAKLALTNPYFMGAVNRISNRVISNAEFVVEQRNEEREWEEVKGHPFMDVIEWPNPMFPFSELLAELVYGLSTYGNHYWFVTTDRPGYGEIQEIWPLMPDKVQPDPTTLRKSPVTGAPVIDYYYTLGERIRLPGENIIHFRTPNLLDFWRGMTPLTGMQRALRMDASETDWLASFFSENNAVPTAIISVPSDLSPEEFELVKQDIIENFGAKRGAAIARSGSIDVKTIQHTIEEMQVLDGLEYNKGAILDVLGVPPGISTASSGESRMAAEMALMRDAVQPMLDIIAASLTSKLNIFYPSHYMQRVVAHDIVPQDTAVATSEYQTYGPDRTLNENRQKLKLEPLQLPEDMKDYQPLYDYVPQRWFELFFNAIAQKNAPPAPPGGMPDASGMPPQLQGAPQAIQGAPKPGMPQINGGMPAPKPQGNGTGPGAKPNPIPQRAGGMGTQQMPISAKSSDDAWLVAENSALVPLRPHIDGLDPAEQEAFAIANMAQPPAFFTYVDADGGVDLYSKSLDLRTMNARWQHHEPATGWAAVAESALPATLDAVSADYAQRFVRRSTPNVSNGPATWAEENETDG